MKWYSTKEHTPVLSGCLVILAVRDKNDNDVSLWMGEWRNGWWYFEEDDPINGDFFEVMYFCYPDPIPGVYNKIIDDNQTD